MKVHVLFGTESGNAEIASDDLAESLRNANHNVDVSDLSSFSITELQHEALYVFICSTYGEGELPNTALTFYNDLSVVHPDISGVRYAMFGLGDTFYKETYGQGATKLDDMLTKLGAERVGQLGRYDASTWEPVGERAIEWFDEVLQEATATL